MRKLKLFSAFAAAFTMLTMAVTPAMADEDPKLPFELTAPENVSITYLDGNDSVNTCSVSYSQNTSMSEFFTKFADPDSHDEVVKQINEMGYDDIWAQCQVDWSIDSTEDWHVNEYWTTEGYDKDYHQHLGDWAYIGLNHSPELVNKAWIFRWMGNIDDPEDSYWYGTHNDDSDIPGWKDVLKEGQYDVVPVNDGEHTAKIDLDKHTIYVRARWMVTVRTMTTYKADEPDVIDEEGKDIVITTDWSNIASVGKDAVKFEGAAKDMVAAPAISDLRMTDEEFNGQPVIAFKIVVPDELISLQTALKANGGDIALETEARVAGTEEWKGLQGDWLLKSGELKVALINLLEEGKVIEKDTPVELRCRYYVTNTNEKEDFTSDYSEVLTFGTKEIKADPTDPPKEEVKEEVEEPKKEEPKVEKKEKEEDDKCSLCGFCPQPLGICIFIWIAIIIIVIVVVIVIVKKSGNKDKKDKK